MSKALVSKATADDAKEPTGFQLKELAQHSYTSLAASTELVEALLKKLDKDSADVKYKALKCIKYLCLHGRAEFRMDIQRDAGNIKTCLHFKGTPDPLRGDAPFQRVRDEAKECMNAVFNGPARTGNQKPAGSYEGYGGGAGGLDSSSSSEKNYGYGEGTFSAGANSSAHVTTTVGRSGTAMVGFGNPQYDNSKGRSSPTFLEKMKQKMNSAAMGETGNTGPYKTYDRSSGFQPPPMATAEATRKRGEVGGVWANAGDSGNTSSLTSNSYHQQSTTSSYVQHNPPAVRPTSSNGEYETRLIDSLTPSAGVRTVPSKEELSKFASQCESLDKLLVVRLINENKLPADAHPATQMKALCLIETVLTTGDARSTEEVEDYLCENAGNLEYIEKQGANVPLRNKAVRVMELCGLREEKKPVHAPQQASTSAFYQPPAAAQPVQQPQADLLGFMAEPAAAPAASNGGSAFGFLENSPAPAAAVPVAAASSGGDMFGSLEVKPQPTAAAAAPAAAGGDMFNLFGSSAQPSTAPRTNQSPPTANPSNSLDFLNASPNPPAAATTAGGSKVDPLTQLMSKANISTQPRPMQQQPNMPQMAPFGSNGMAAYPPRQPMVPLGPSGPHMGYPPQGYPGGVPMQGGYPMQPYGAYPPQGYPPQQGGYPQMMGAQHPPLGAQQMPLGSFPAAAGGAANTNALFNVKAAGSGAQPLAQMRPTIDLDPLGNPILLGNNSSSSTSTSGGLNSNQSAFGFVASGGDSFGFVNDMMAKK